jgi:hypothetical protein
MTVLLRRVVWYKFTDVSELLNASTIRAVLLTEAVSISETSVNFNQTTRPTPQKTVILILAAVKTSNITK